MNAWWQLEKSQTGREIESSAVAKSVMVRNFNKVEETVI